LGLLKNIIKGIAIGISMMVPGVSGGTMAIVLGIYDRLVHSVAAFFSDWKKNLPFLLQVGAGGAVGVLIFSRFMEGAMMAYPHIMRYLIMGIIIGGLPLLYRKATEELSSSPAKGVSQTPKTASAEKSKSQSAGTYGKSKVTISDFAFLVLGIVIVLVMAQEPESLIGIATDGSLVSYIFLLVSGFIIAIGLVLPGISWSFMLLVLGMYEITLNAINTFNIPFLIPLGIGIGLGTIGTAKLIEKFLQKYPRKTYMLIIGFVVGSLAEVFPGIPQGWQIPVSLAAFAAGFALMFVLGKKGLTD